jgi:hypothetical protein
MFSQILQTASYTTATNLTPFRDHIKAAQLLSVCGAILKEPPPYLPLILVRNDRF